MNLIELKAKLDYSIKRVQELQAISYKSEDYNELKGILKESNEIFAICDSNLLEIAYKDLDTTLKCCQLSTSLIGLNTYTVRKCQKLISDSVENIINYTNKTYEASVSILENLNK